jgi:hypothetical protein
VSDDTSPLWFGVYGREYEGKEPAFFDESEFEWTGILKNSFPEIRAALEPLMQDGDGELKPYFDEVLQYPPRNWKTIGFYFWGKKDYENLKRFPGMARVLSRIPGLVTASFNMLEPHSRIRPHFGETNAVYRVHLGVKVPAALPSCGFTVKGESRSWEEGGLLVFLDANVHEAFNDTDERRYILLLDIMRPEYARQKRKICIQALSMLSLYFVIAHIPRFPIATLHKNAHRIPPWFTNWILLAPFKLIWNVYWPIHQKVNLKKIFRI